MVPIFQIPCSRASFSAARELARCDIRIAHRRSILFGMCLDSIFLCLPEVGALNPKPYVIWWHLERDCNLQNFPPLGGSGLQKGSEGFLGTGMLINYQSTRAMTSDRDAEPDFVIAAPTQKGTWTDSPKP